MTTRAGTLYYVSPEVLLGKYDELCDVWSLGVVLYVLLSGFPPFSGDNDLEIMKAVKKAEYNFDSSEWDNVSKEAKNLITKLLCKPETRYKAGEILKHPWMTAKDTSNMEKPLSLNYDNLKNFRNAAKLKKAALTYIASQLSEKEISHISKLFLQLDKNGDGVLTFEEVKEGLKELPPESAKEI